MNPRLIYLLFFLSGFSGLLFEVVWTRLLLRLFGVGTIAGACVLGALMAGLGLGAFLSGRVPRTVNPLIAYGVLELVVAACGIGIPSLLSSPVAEWWLSHIASVAQSDFSWLTTYITASLILLIPSTAMGATYPLLLRALPSNNPSHAILLYAFNVAGATAGTITTGFTLLPSFGLTLTSTIGSVLEVLIAAAALVSSKLHITQPESALGKRARDVASAPEMVLILTVGAVAAMGILLQLCWYRLYFLLLGNSVYSHATVVSTVLLGICFGTFLARHPTFDGENARARLPHVVACACLSTAAGIFAFPYLPWIWLNAVTAFGSDPFLLRWFLAALVVFVPSVSIGAVLPLSIKAASEEEKIPADHAAGILYAANCFGAFVGAVFGGIVLFKHFAQNSDTALRDCLLTALVILGVVTILLAVGMQKKRRFGFSQVAALVSIALALFSPWDSVAMSQGISFFTRADLSQIDPKSILPRPDRSPIFYREGLNSTVSLTQGPNIISLRTDGKVEASLAKNRALAPPQSDEATHILLGALPMLLCPESPADVLLIGMGSGTTCATILTFADLNSLTVAEIEKGVIDAAHKLSPYNGMQIPDAQATERSPAARLKKVGRILTTDARFVLASESRTYNVIICQPGDPWVTGSSDLFTREFWELTRRRLSDNGVCCQWMQAYGLPKSHFIRLLATFKSVYPETYVCHTQGAGELVLLGFKSKPPLSLEVMNQRLGQDPYRLDLLARGGITKAADAVSLIKLDAPAVTTKLSNEKIDPLHLFADDRPTLEFAAAKALANPEPGISENLGWMLGKPATEPVRPLQGQ